MTWSTWFGQVWPLHLFIMPIHQRTDNLFHSLLAIFVRVPVHPDCNNRFRNFTLTSVNENMTAGTEFPLWENSNTLPFVCACLKILFK